ncbi:hypothetical protein [Nocardia altamirensis]|uniref:hypothetical protein n=1 Tax=Nocardia altamirensis TaxID=472158 RepID=UPI000B2D33E0|nr:hypothetical protein [Nocardia altamirensis]
MSEIELDTDTAPTPSLPQQPAREPVAGPTPANPTTQPRGRSVHLEIATLVRGAVIAVLVIAVAVLSVFLVLARDDLADSAAAAAADRHAEQVATDYAIGASTIDYADLNTWVAKLKANTSPALSGKFDAVGPKMGELLTPLKWTSTATPVTATVSARNNGVYTVNVFVNLSVSNVQNPKAAFVTATYTVTVDANAGWKITEVGGLGGALPVK